MSVLLVAAAAPSIAYGDVVRRGLQGSSGARQEGEATPPRSAVPFGQNTVGLEFAGAILLEAWNLNERREWLAGGNAAIWWAFRERVALAVELQAARVFQSPARNALVQGLTPLLRWRVHDADPWTVFVELGPGISWSDRPVPPRGTRFNFLTLVGGGITRRLGERTQFVTGFRWLHLSNAGREGRDRNPDIEALGPYVGVRMSF